MSELGVVHLVRQKNGLVPFGQFLASYRVNGGGVPHELVLLYKGFRNVRQLVPYEALASDIPHRILRITDAGLDVWAYSQAASLLDCGYLCLLNSYSRPLDPDWLRKMWQHAQSSDVGAVGATGSYQSFHSRHMQVMAPARGAGLPATLRQAWRLLNEKGEPGLRRRRLSSAVLRVLGIHNPVRDFPAHPNPHLRTNGFLLSRELLLRLEGSRVFSKRAAFLFESGMNSMTNQILQRGLQVFIVGRDGKAYAPAQWPVSGTFRLGMQPN